MRRAVVLSALVLAVSTAALALSACGGDKPGPVPPSPTPMPTTTGTGQGSDKYRDTDSPALPASGHALGRDGYWTSPLADPLGRFGLDLLSRQAATHEGNVVLSPASIHAALAMTLNGAQGETAAEMRRALAIDRMERQAVDQAWADVIARAHSIRGVQIRIADSLWLRNGVALKPDFVQKNRDYFAADTSALADDPVQAAADVNKWVEDRTGGRIKDLVQKVDPAVFLMLVNTIYVKAGWENFEEEQTRPEPFTLTDGTKVDVPMMNGYGDRVASTDEYDAVALEAHGPVTVWVVVPKGSQTPESVVARLRERGLASLADDSSQPVIHLALPRFRIEYTADTLVEDLKRMGMSRAFSPDAAEFGAMTDVKPAWIYAIAHKAVLEVNEEGVEAAAGTAVEMAGALPPTDQVSVRADRPFVVVLSQGSPFVESLPLFMAIVRDPR